MPFGLFIFAVNLESWQKSGEFFDYNGLPIFFRRSQNQAAVTLLLHGFPSASWDWHKVWNALAEKYALLAFDMIGYGFSAKPADFNYTTFAQVDLLQALLEKLQVERVNIFAHDYGNTITQELLARRAENRLKFTIDSICFLNGALFPETHRPILAQKILISPLGFLFGKFITDSRFENSLASVFGKKTQPTREELNSFRRLFQHNGGRNIAHLLIRYMTERRTHRERWVGALEKADVPFRMINGLADPVSGAHLVQRFREIMPHTDIIELPEIGHYPQVEAPQTVINHYFEFRSN
jgi:pimeloyl-ACP methyl ester carboxylesterase